MDTMRQTNGAASQSPSTLHSVWLTCPITDYTGLSPFTKRSESPFDCFGAGHSSTSISAGLGMAVARVCRASPTTSSL